MEEGEDTKGADSHGLRAAMMTFYDDKYPEPMAVPGLPVPEEACSLDLWVGTGMGG